MFTRHQDTRRNDIMATTERRKEARGVAAGRVSLSIGDRGHPAVVALLLDVSENGFRAAHDCPDLRAGIEVSFTHRHGSGRARIVWNRIVDGRWESGFFVVNPGS